MNSMELKQVSEMVTKELEAQIMAGNLPHIDEAALKAKDEEMLRESFAGFSEKIARGATSWNKAYPGKKEVPRNVAVACRACMQMARAKGGYPTDYMEIACQIRQVEVSDFVESLDQLSDDSPTTIQVSRNNRDRLKAFGYPIDAALSKVLDIAESTK